MELKNEQLEKVNGGAGEITVKCPKCGYSISTTISDINISGSMVCPSCNHRFALETIEKQIK